MCCGKDKFGRVDVEKQIKKAQERKVKKLKELRAKYKELVRELDALRRGTTLIN